MPPIGVLVPPPSSLRCGMLWRVTSTVGTVVVLALLLVSALLVCGSCTIERVILYNTEQNPSPRATAIGKIGPNG